MSQWKFNNFSADIDFTDADFLERIESEYEKMLEDNKKLPKTGKVSHIVREQCKVFDNFFDGVFGVGTSSKMFGGKNSMELRVKATNSLYDLRSQEQSRYNELSNKYRPNRNGRGNKKR